MKLVKIEDVRIGQIYKEKILDEIYIIESFNDIRYTLSSCFKNKILICKDEYELTNSEIESCELIGFLGITHEIKDNKLIEIQREELGNTGCYIDDVFINEYEEVEGVVLGMSRDGYIRLLEPDGKDIYETGTITEKIGILGVNYEFINNKLVKENE